MDQVQLQDSVEEAAEHLIGSPTLLRALTADEVAAVAGGPFVVGGH